MLAEALVCDVRGKKPDESSLPPVVMRVQRNRWAGNRFDTITRFWAVMIVRAWGQLTQCSLGATTQHLSNREMRLLCVATQRRTSFMLSSFNLCNMNGLNELPQARAHTGECASTTPRVVECFSHVVRSSFCVFVTSRPFFYLDVSLLSFCYPLTR